MSPEELDTKFESFCGLVLERLDKMHERMAGIEANQSRLEGLLGNHALETARDIRALTEAVRNLADETLANKSDISALRRRGDTEPSPGPNGDAA